MIYQNLFIYYISADRADALKKFKKFIEIE